MEPYETFTWQQKETNTANYLKKRNKYFRLNNYIIITLFLTCSIIGAFFLLYIIIYYIAHLFGG